MSLDIYRLQEEIKLKLNLFRFSWCLKLYGDAKLGSLSALHPLEVSASPLAVLVCVGVVKATCTFKPLIFSLIINMATSWRSPQAGGSSAFTATEPGCVERPGCARRFLWSHPCYSERRFLTLHPAPNPSFYCRPHLFMHPPIPRAKLSLPGHPRGNR